MQLDRPPFAKYRQIFGAIVDLLIDPFAIDPRHDRAHRRHFDPCIDRAIARDFALLALFRTLFGDFRPLTARMSRFLARSSRFFA